jgi:hypothetical protein
VLLTSHGVPCRASCGPGVLAQPLVHLFDHGQWRKLTMAVTTAVPVPVKAVSWLVYLANLGTLL